MANFGLDMRQKLNLPERFRLTCGTDLELFTNPSDIQYRYNDYFTKLVFSVSKRYIHSSLRTIVAVMQWRGLGIRWEKFYLGET